jgi:NitT/TauT family transport system substrate-binding protein
MGPLERRVSRWPAMLRWLTLGSAALLAACAPAATAPPAAQPAAGGAPVSAPTTAVSKPTAAREVTLRLDWQTIGYHAPFWAAMEKGFFAEQGLDVKVLEGNGSATTLQLLSSGQAQAGFADAVVMAQAIQKGMDVRMVACLLQQNLFGIISPADAPLARPEDLRGKTIAAVLSGVDGFQWPIFAKKVGLDPDAVTIINTDVPGKYAALMARRVDATFQLVPIDALQFEAQGLPVHQLLYADYGVERLGHGLVFSSSTLKDSPDVAAGLAAGLAKGWQYAADNPAEVATFAGKLFTTSLSAETLEKQWRATIPFGHSERTRNRPLFWMDNEDWEQMQVQLRNVDYLTETLPIDRYYTNEFLPQS